MAKAVKKSETIEVRVSHDLKRALMSKAAGEGRSASDVVRHSIDSYVQGLSGAEANPWRHVAAFAVAALILLFAYSLSTPAAADHRRDFEAAKARLAFAQTDLSDRKRLATEFAGEFGKERLFVAAFARPGMKHAAFSTLDLNSDGWLSLAEFRQLMDVPPGVAGRKLFESKDSNHDGRLSEQEFGS